jgi:hypothetical protein
MMRRMLEAQQRERMHIAAQMSTIKGLMPLLMKRRNGQRWSRAERADLYGQLRALTHLSPYLLTLALPGSFLMLPLLAWWLDRRRGQRRIGLENDHLTYGGAIGEPIKAEINLVETDTVSH